MPRSVLKGRDTKLRIVGLPERITRTQKKGGAYLHIKENPIMGHGKMQLFMVLFGTQWMNAICWRMQEPWTQKKLLSRLVGHSVL